METKNEITKANNPLSIKEYFGRDVVKNKFTEMLGKRATSFITSVLQIAASNALLSKADPTSIYQSASMAATLDLPLNNSLGFAYIVPYNSKQKDGSYRVIAQFQMGYKGFIQLAQRSGQFRAISACPVHEGQIKSENPLTGYEFDFSVKSDSVIGYAAYFSLINGFEKTIYMTVDELKKHGQRFSQSFKKNYGLWVDDFDSMAMKTVLKMLLSKYAPLSVDMQKAVITDQSVIKDAENEEVEYVDNEVIYEDAQEVSEEKENERIESFVKEASTVEQLNEALPHIKTPEQTDLFNQKLTELKEKTKGGKK